MSIEGVASPSENNGPRPFYESFFFFLFCVGGKVDIANGCNASKEDEDSESDRDPTREGNTSPVSPIMSIYTVGCDKSVSNTSLVIFTLYSPKCSSWFSALSGPSGRSSIGL